MSVIVVLGSGPVLENSYFLRGFSIHNRFSCDCNTNFFPCFFQGPFDAVRKLLSGAESSKMNLNEKSDLFFCDYSIMPLFVQENYLMVEPGGGR